MTPDSPIRFPGARQCWRWPWHLRVRRLIAGTGALAVAGALAATAALPAQAESPAPATAGQHVATARIAALEWCGDGPIGDIDTDRAGGNSSGHWSDDPQDLGGARHFPAPPHDTSSAARRDDDSLTARSTISHTRLSPRCTQVPGAGEDEPATLTEVFEVDDVVSFDSVRSTSTWSRDGGASARLAVHGLEILGEPADVSDGTYRTSRTGALDGGDRLRVDASVQPRANELSGGADRASAANAGMAVRLDVTRFDKDGQRSGEEGFRVDFAGTAVHSDRDLTRREPRESRSPSASTDSAGDPDSAPGGAPSGASPGDPSGEPTPSPSTGPSPSGTAGATPPVSATGGSGDDTVPAPPSNDGALPVSGGALIGLVAAGLVSLGGGGAAVYLGRRRTSGIDD